MRDATGTKLRIGDLVRVIGIPDLKGMSPDGVRESLPVFEYLVGKYKRVRGFSKAGEIGLVELSFKIRKGPHKGIHWVVIEPEFLRVKGARSKAT